MTIKLADQIPLSGPYTDHEFAVCEFGPSYIKVEVVHGKGEITLTREEVQNLVKEVKKYWRADE